ncbi:MAG: hypothetical protein HQL40_04170 [Alphaproteobacteria bacterium]|nr:hypothetical protein [Alphaproteobacteria bacterium]
MRLLLAISHHQPAWGDAALRRRRRTLLMRQIRGLRELFASPWCMLDARRGLHVQPGPGVLHVVVCTTLDENLSGGGVAFEHRPVDCPPEHLPFACQRVLSEARGGAWDFHGWLEEGLMIEDPYFFAKLAAFNRRAEALGAEPPPILLPRRFEAAADSELEGGLLPRLYPDHGEPLGEAPPIELPHLDSAVVCEATDFPHAGCFLLDRAQLDRAAAHPNWGVPVFDPASPIDCAASRVVAQRFTVYQTSGQHLGFLQVRRGHPGFLEQIAVENGSVTWRPRPEEPDLAILLDRFFALDARNAGTLLNGLGNSIDAFPSMLRHIERRADCLESGMVCDDFVAQVEPPLTFFAALAAALTLSRSGATEEARNLLGKTHEMGHPSDRSLPDRICDAAELMHLAGRPNDAAAVGGLLELTGGDPFRVAELHLMDGRPERCLAALEAAPDNRTLTLLKGWAMAAMGETDAAAQWLDRRHAAEGPTSESLAVLALIDLAAGDVERAGRRLDEALRADIPSIEGLTVTWDDHAFVAACRGYCEKAYGDPHGAQAKLFWRAILDERPDYMPAFRVWTHYARCLGPPAAPGSLPDILLNNRGVKGGSAVQPILFDALAQLGYSFAPMSDKSIHMTRFLRTESPIAQWSHMSVASLVNHATSRPDRRRLVVAVVRDPRDVLMSTLARRHPEGLENAPPPDEVTAVELELGVDIWAVRQPDVLVVRVEDVRIDPEGQLRRILDAAGITLDDDAIRRAAAGKSLAELMARRRARSGKDLPIAALGQGVLRKGVTGEWRHAPPALKKIMFRDLRDAVRELGYEPDDSWGEG